MDMTVMYEDYKHIGNEFLTWIWFQTDKEKDFNFSVGNKVVFSREKDTVTIKGEESDIIVGKVAMSDEYIVSEMQLIYSTDDPRFSFVIKGQDLSLRSLKVPATQNDGEDMDGYIIEKMSYVEELYSAIDKLYKEFILLRTDEKKWREVTQWIKSWIEEG